VVDVRIDVTPPGALVLDSPPPAIPIRLTPVPRSAARLSNGTARLALRRSLLSLCPTFYFPGCDVSDERRVLRLGDLRVAV
jgi:hypothetical protein